METKFVSLNDKTVLVEGLMKGDHECMKLVIEELDRLERVIKDYEIGMKFIVDKFSNDTNKESVKLTTA